MHVCMCACVACSCVYVCTHKTLIHTCKHTQARAHTSTHTMAYGSARLNKRPARKSRGCDGRPRARIWLTRTTLAALPLPPSGSRFMYVCLYACILACTHACICMYACLCACMYALCISLTRTTLLHSIYLHAANTLRSAWIAVNAFE